MREEELLAHGDFIRGLARRLIPDEFWAADVAQQTFTAALEYPPTDDKPPRAWLATVTRNFAHKFYRRESIRETKERFSGARGSMPSTSSVVEREEIRRKVVDAVLDLEEPYRSTLLLRFYEELSPREVARRMDAPDETIRTRIKRGLKHLRARLDSLYEGDRKQWCIALAPFAAMKIGVGAAAASGLSSISSLLQSTTVKLCAAALLVLGVSLTVYWNWSDPSIQSADEIHSMDEFGAGDTKTGVNTETDVEVSSVEDPFIDDPAKKVALIPETNRILEGVVIHKDSKRPLAGLNIKVCERQIGWKQPIEFIQTLTGPDGRFRIEGAPWLECDVVLADKNYFSDFNRSVSFKKSNHPDPIVLTAEPGAYLQIRVLGEDGKAEPFAMLTIGKKWENGSAATMYPFICDDKGYYFLNSGLRAETKVTVVARSARSKMLSQTVFVKPKIGESNEAVMRISGGSPVYGRILDEDNRPMSGVQVNPHVVCPEESGMNTISIPETIDLFSDKSVSDNRVFSDDDGYFKVEGLSPGDYRLFAKPEDFDKAYVDVHLPGGSAQIQKDLVLRLKQSLMVRGYAVDEDSMPVTGEDGACVFFYQTAATTSQLVKYSIDCDKEDGAFKFPSSRIWTEVSLSKGDQLDLVVMAPGYIPYVKRNVKPGDKEIMAVLKRGGCVSGKVVSSITENPLSCFRINRVGDDSNIEPYASVKHHLKYLFHFNDPCVMRFKDIDGRFDFKGLAPGEHTLTIEAEGYSNKQIDVTIPADLSPIEGVKVVLRPCLAIEGTVFKGEKNSQKPFIDASVTACLADEGTLQDQSVGAIYSDGLQEIVTVQTDALGKFKLEGLESGAYHLKVSKEKYSQEYWKFGPYQIQSGKEQKELTLNVETLTGRVKVHVLDRNNRHVNSGANVICSTPYGSNDGSTTISAKTDDQGIARLEGVKAGLRSLHVRVEDDLHAWWVNKEIDVLANQETLVTVQQPGSSGYGATIRGRAIKDGVPCPGIKLLFSSTADQSRSEQAVTDSKGEYLFPNVAPGTYDIFGPGRKGVFIKVDRADSVIDKDIIVPSKRITGMIQTIDYKSIDNAFGMFIDCYQETSKKSLKYPCRSVAAKKDGGFSIDHLDDGRYTLCAKLSIGDLKYIGLLRHVMAQDERMNQAVSITLERAGKIKIAEPNARYGEDLDIRLLYLLDQQCEIEIIPYTIIPKGKNNIHQFNNLLPGAYRIDLSTPSGAAYSQTVELIEGEIKEVELR